MLSRNNSDSNLSAPNNLSLSSSSSTAASQASSTPDPVMLKKQQQALEAKQKDLEALFTLTENLNHIISLDNPNIQLIHTLLTDIANCFKKIARNKNDATYIRNLYGKINYKSNKKNDCYLSFDLYPKLLHLSAADLVSIATIICHHWNIYKEQLIKLQNNLFFIIKKEGSEPQIKTIIEPIITSKLVTDSPKATWENLKELSSLIEFYCDKYCLEYLSSEDMYKLMLSIDTAPTPESKAYAFSRFLTIIGEETHSLSEHSRLIFNDLGFKALNKIRNQLGHAHHYLIRKCPPELQQYKEQVTISFPQWQQSIQGRCQYYIDLACSDNYVVEVHDEAVKRMRPSVEQLPLNLRRLAHIEASKKLEIPAETKPYDKSLLCAVRFKKLLEYKYDLLEKSRRIELPQQSSSSSAAAVTDRNENKKQNCRQVIRELEHKSSRTRGEEKKLTSAKALLEKLNATLKPTAVLPTAESTAHDIAVLDEELSTLNPYPIFEKLLDYLTPPRASGNPKVKNPMQEMANLMKGLESEIKTICKMKLPDDISGQRNLAMECCVAAIGQYMRDINDLNDEFFSILLLENSTIGKAVGITTNTRNSQIMHDTRGDNTTAITDVVTHEVLPLLEDMTALRTISESKLQKLAEQTANQLAQVSYDTARAYNRLNKTTEAIDNYKEAIRYLSPEFQADFQGIRIDDLLLIVEVVEGVEDSQTDALSKAAAWKGRTVIFQRSLKNIIDRVVLYTELGTCYSELKQYEQAASIYKIAYDMYVKYSLHNYPGIDHHSLLLNMFSVMIFIGKDPDEVLSNTLQWLPNNSQQYVLLILNAIPALKELKRIDVAIRWLLKIEPTAITDKYIAVDYYHKLATSRMTQYINNNPNSYQECQKMANSILAAVKEANNLLSTCFADMKSQHGDNATKQKNCVEVNTRRITEQLAIYISNMGNQCAQHDNQRSLTQATCYFSLALLIQREYMQEHSLTLLNLAEAQRSLARFLNSEKKTALFQKAEANYDLLTNHPRIRYRIAAETGKAQIRWYKNEHLAAIPHYINVLSYYEIEIGHSQSNIDPRLKEDYEYARKELDCLMRRFSNELESLRLQYTQEKSLITNDATRIKVLEKKLQIVDRYTCPTKSFTIS